MNRPTVAQRQKLWEWCGIKYVLAPSPYVEYCFKNDDESYFSFAGYPSLDLNNLFKYAVPKGVNGVVFNWTTNEVTVTFMYPDKHSHFGIRMCWGKAEIVDGNLEKACALALFWALWKVKNEQ